MFNAKPDIFYGNMLVRTSKRSDAIQALPRNGPNVTFHEISVFSVRQHTALLSALYAIARPSVRLSVRHTGG